MLLMLALLSASLLQGAAESDRESALDAQAAALKARVDAQARTITARLVAEIGYDNCIRNKSLSLAKVQPGETAGTIVDAAADFCADMKVFMVARAYDQGKAYGDPNATIERWISDWDASARRAGRTCVVAARVDPQSIGLSVCKAE